MADKKTLYHSELVKLSPLEARVVKNPIPSKFKKGSFFVPLLIDGVERSYGCENKQCVDAFEGLEGFDVTITATGSREESAIEIEQHGGPEADDTGEPQRPPQPAKQAPKQAPKPTQAQRPPAQPASQAAPQSAPATKVLSEEEQRKAMVQTWAMLMQHGNLMKLCLKRVLELRDEVQAELGYAMTDAHIQGATTTLYIEMKDYHNPRQATMPTKPLALKKETHAKE